MPANLNALIRYKTINSCLYGGRRRWTVRELRDACSEALAESRGRYEPVSERTLRDDIRVMRSDILGFNAPISQKGGMYFYADPRFTILSLNITDAGLADKIFDFMNKLRTEVLHPELETILEQLCKLTGKPYELPVMTKPADLNPQEDISVSCQIVQMEQPDLLSLTIPKSIKTDSQIRFSVKVSRPSVDCAEWIKKEENLLRTVKPFLSWGGIFAKIT